MNKRDALIEKRDSAKEQVKELENDIDEAHKELSKYSKNKEDLEKAASDLGKFKNNKEQTEAEIKKLKQKEKIYYLLECKFLYLIYTKNC